MAKFDVIKQLLDSQNVSYKVVDLPGKAISVEDVIKLTAGKIKREEVIKTLIIKTKQGDLISCVLKGEDQLELSSIAGERLATKEEVLKTVGVKIGAVCPILIGIPLVIDKKVAELKRVNMGSGDHLKGLEMDCSDLLKVLSGYTVKEISV